MNQRKKFFVYIFVSIVIFITSFLMFKKSMSNYSQDMVNYVENSSIDYKVYLKKNNYFDTPFLEKNKVYITSLIDYIDIDFSYNLKFDSKKSGRYVYYIKGIMSANVSNTDKDYWQKNYNILKLTEETYDNVDNINLNKNIKIDYVKYNKLLLKFKEEFKLTMDGSFKAVLCIDNYIKSNDGSELLKTTVTDLEIPLTKATIEVPIKVNEINNSSKLYGDLVYNNSTFNNILKISSIVLFVLGLLLISYSVFKLVRSFEKLSSYNKELKKILKTYDGIIVNVKSAPNYSLTNVINVNSFSELLDAHSEIRQPITFFEKDKKAIFTLINNNVMWKYVLKDLKYEKEN